MNPPGYPTEKQLRAQVIHRYMRDADIAKAVCFTCGNAGRALLDARVDVLNVGPRQDIEARRWFTPDEIRAVWPDRFDATPGHLPLHLLTRIAGRMRTTWPTPTGTTTVPTGSGETIVCTRLAWPAAHLVAAYDNRRPETTYSPKAPLNDLVRIVADRIVHIHTTAEMASFAVTGAWRA